MNFHRVGEISFFLIKTKLCLSGDHWEEESWHQMNLNWLRPFSYSSNCWLLDFPYGETKINKKTPKKATLLVAQYRKTKVWTRCLSQPHTTRVQFFVIVLHHGYRLLETSEAVDRSPKSLKEKLVGRQTTPTFLCGGLAAAARITPWCGKKIPQRRRMPFRYRIAWLESDIHIFYVRDFCRRRCRFRTGSKTHKRLKERFLFRRNGTKRANFRGKPLLQATYSNTVPSLLEMEEYNVPLGGIPFVSLSLFHLLLLLLRRYLWWSLFTLYLLACQVNSPLEIHVCCCVPCLYSAINSLTLLIRNFVNSAWSLSWPSPIFKVTEELRVVTETRIFFFFFYCESESTEQLLSLFIILFVFIWS